jgi:hypothetical protein
MGWTRALKRVRRWEHTQSLNIRQWVTKFFHEQDSKKNAVFLKFKAGTLSKSEFTDLLETDDAKRLIVDEERAECIKNFETLTEEQMDEILSNVFPKQFTLTGCIESLHGKPKDGGFTPTEWFVEYNTALHYFSRERRENLLLLLTEFWNDEVYQRYIAEGHTDDEIFSKFIDTCSAYGVHPLYCDLSMYGGDGFYKLLDLSHYVLLLRRRTGAIASELKSKAEEVRAIEAKGIDLQLPAVNGEFRERLEGGDNIYETLKFPLPPHTEPEAQICPFDTCRRKFKNKEMLERHLKHKHQAVE